MEGYIFKRFCVLFLVVSLCTSTAGFMSLANYSNSDMRSEIDFLEDSDLKVVESVDEEIITSTVASASNTVRTDSVVTTAAELETAIEIAEDGDVIVISNNIYLSKALYITKSLEFKTIENVDEISIYSNGSDRHFIIIGDEIELKVDNVIFDGNGLSGGLESNAEHLILSGAIIQNCVSPLINGSNYNTHGGGLYSLGKLTLINSEISKNNAFNGGGIYATNNLEIVDSIISENKATYGGGIYATNNLEMVNSIISENEANGGGGISASNCGIVKINNSAFSNNKAGTSHGGGLSIRDCNIVEINNSIFSDNKVESDNLGAATGGGIFSYQTTSVSISDCEFIGNSSDMGGALYLNGYDTTIDNSDFINNSARIHGGALYISEKANISNCNFTKNNASHSGGGIYVLLIKDEIIQITNSKIWENTATSYGGGVFVSYLSSFKPIPFEDALIISNCEIVNNTAMSGGGIGCLFTDEFIKIKDYSIVKNNFAQFARRLSNEDDIAKHNQLIDSTVAWTDGFDYIYNGIDVQYSGNAQLLTVYKISIVELQENKQDTTFYPVVKDEQFHYNITIPEGYKAIIESNADLDIDMEAGTIEIAAVISDVDINITYKLIEEETTHTVTLITHYLDGVREDESISYQVASGDSFEQTYEALEGYEFAGMSIRSSYPVVDGDTQTVYIDNVTEDYTITIKLARKVLNVKVTTQYIDGILPDATTSYSVLYGDDFAESYEALEGYTFVGMSVRSFPYVDGDLQIVYIDEVKEDYHIIIKLDRAEYNVIITVQYPEGTIESQVYTYSVLYGESFIESFEVESGYRVAGVQAEKGVDVDSQNRVVEIERVLKDMSITIICR